MVLSTGYSKIKTAVFISGTGSNLKSLIKFSKTNKSPISIEFVFSNNSKAKGLDYSKKHNIKIKISGIFPMSYLKFDYPQSNKIMTVYIQLMLDRNILASNRFYANNSHSIKDVEIYLRKLDEVFNIINKAIKNKELDKYLKGPIIKKGFHKFK